VSLRPHTSALTTSTPIAVARMAQQRLTNQRSLTSGWGTSRLEGQCPTLAIGRLLSAGADGCEQRRPGRMAWAASALTTGRMRAMPVATTRIAQRLLFEQSQWLAARIAQNSQSNRNHPSAGRLTFRVCERWLDAPRWNPRYLHASVHWV